MLKRYGTEIRPRAPGQHARMIERRGAILRHSLHTAEEQFAREGIEVTMEYLLAEMVFSGNALVSTGGATPYHARFGCQPQMLPDITAPADDTSAGPGRDCHRIRETALQRIIEGTAIARINRAMRSMTTAPGEAIDYKPDEPVDYYRKPGKQGTLDGMARPRSCVTSPSEDRFS